MRRPGPWGFRAFMGKHVALTTSTSTLSDGIAPSLFYFWFISLTLRRREPQLHFILAIKYSKYKAIFSEYKKSSNKSQAMDKYSDPS